MKLFNYLSRKVEDFKPIGDNVYLYTCGPTVYDFVHIGNWRTFVFEDILKRSLIYSGFKVKHVMNITDIEDKIINRANQEKITVSELTRKYEDAFFEDLSQLNIQKADKYTRATEYIVQMQEMIKALIDKGFAYVVDESVYFSIAKFKDYGKLSGTNIKGVKAGARVDVDEYDKENPGDFALWKKAKEADKSAGEAFDSPWGIGRPGWHIECSAMSTTELGESIDIHAGGIDLLFPHHENEIAQSEAANGKKFVNYWVEGEHLLVDGEKMSKKLGNIFTLTDVVKKGFDPLALRYLFLTAHYRSKLNFTWESLKGAQNALENLRELVSDLKSDGNGDAKVSNEFLNAISNDLDMPRAVAELWKIVKSDMDQSAKKAVIIEMDKVFGLGISDIKKIELTKEEEKLVRQREELRKGGNFEESDRIRKELAEMGVEVEDTPDGPKITKH